MEFRNDSGVTIPAFGIFKINGADDPPTTYTSAMLADQRTGGETLLSADFTDEASALWAVNGPTPVLNGYLGNCTRESPFVVQYDTADGIPENGQVWGASAVDFKLHKNRVGFRIIGRPGNGLVLAIEDNAPKTKLELKTRLSEGGTATAWRTKWNGSVWERTSDTVTVYGTTGWAGVRFGSDESGEPSADSISYIDAWLSSGSGRFYATGCGVMQFRGTAGSAIAAGATGSVVAVNYAGISVTARATADVENGETVVAEWDSVEREWLCAPAAGDAYSAGCHTDLTDHVISVTVETVIGTNAGLEVIPGTGEDCDTIGVKAGCGVVVDADGVGFDNAAVAGCGLQAGSGCTLEVDNAALAGNGLTPGTGCTLDVDLSLLASCGIDITAGIISVDRTDLIGNGLEAGPTGCLIKVKEACGINVGAGGVSVDRADLIATDGGLQAGGGTCDIKVKDGCGIVVNADGVGIYRPEIMGDGLEAGPTGCLIKVKEGCGISVDTNGVAVNLNVLVSNGNNVSGLSVEPGEGEEPCSYIKVNTGCGLEINGSGEVVVKRGDLMQTDGGIVAGSGTCDMKVDLSDTSPLWSETYTCIPFVQTASWNTETCELTKTVKYLRIPDNIPVTITDTPC